jgi:hypothetical protein
MVLFVPGVVEFIVALAEAELRPAFALLDQANQPFLAFVLIVATLGVGLVPTEPVLKLPSESELALNEKLKV